MKDELGLHEQLERICGDREREVSVDLGDVLIDQSELLPTLHNFLLEKLEQNKLEFHNLRVQVAVFSLELARDPLALEVEECFARQDLLEAEFPLQCFCHRCHLCLKLF